MQQIKREGSIKGEGGLHKELKISALPLDREEEEEGKIKSKNFVYLI